MTSKEAKQQVETRQQALAALLEKKAAAAADLRAIQDQWSAAIRALAHGDGTQRKTIRDLKEKLESLKDDLEGLVILSGEAEEALAGAKENLKEAQAQEQAREAEAIRQLEFAECERIAAQAPDLENRIAEAYFALSDVLTELALASARLQMHPGPGRLAIAELREKIHFRLDRRLAASGRRLLNSNLGTNVLPSITYTPEMAGCFYLGGLNLVDLHNKVLGPGIAQKHREEFQKTKSEA